MKLENELHTSISESKIYELLKRLYEFKWLHKYYDNSKNVEAYRKIFLLNYDPVSINYRTYYFLCLEYLVFVEQLYLTNLSYSFWQRW